MIVFFNVQFMVDNFSSSFQMLFQCLLAYVVSGVKISIILPLFHHTMHCSPASLLFSLYLRLFAVLLSWIWDWFLRVYSICCLVNFFCLCKSVFFTKLGTFLTVFLKVLFVHFFISSWCSFTHMLDYFLSSTDLLRNSSFLYIFFLFVPHIG